MSFTINIAKGIKKPKQVNATTKVSRLCLGTTIIVDNNFMCKVALTNKSINPDCIVVPFTERSLDLKDKLIVFELNKDKNGHYVEHHRDATYAHIFPGMPSQYTSVVEGEICSGYIIRKDGKLYFDMLEVHGRGIYLHDIPNSLNEDKPLFNNKSDEYNTD